MAEHLFKNWMVYVLMGGFVWFVLSIYRNAKHGAKEENKDKGEEK